MQIDPHPLIQTHSGEDIQLAFHVTDASGTALDISNAVASYKMARRAGDAALLVKTENDAITRIGHIVTVSLNTADLEAAGQPLIGDFWGQLTLTLDGVTLVVAEGPLSVAPVIT
jgi:hypothetical protein